MKHQNPNRVKKFDKSFKERLEKELIFVQKKFIQKERDFVIDLCLGIFLFQIVNNKVLDTSKYEERGFGIFLSIDESTKYSREQLARFKNKAYSREFKFTCSDCIPVYQLDLGLNTKRLIEVVTKLLVEVYELDLEIISVDTFEL